MVRNFLSIIFFTAISLFAQNKILIYMDLQQTDHLKAYGITYSALADGETADWLLNYRGGSFLLDYSHYQQQGVYGCFL